MGERWSKIAGFWASVLLTLCVLEGALPLRSTPERPDVVQALEQFSLRMRVVVPESAPEGAGTVEVFRLEPSETPFGRPTTVYQRAYSEKGSGSRMVEAKLPTGRYWIVARTPSMARIARFVELVSDQTLELRFAPAAPFLVKVLVEEEGELTPLSGATVLVGERGELPVGQRTDVQGQVRFEDLSSGAKRVRIFAPGYAPYEGIAEGELLVRLRPVSTLRVHVVDGSTPQSDASVFIGGVQLWPARTVLTGDSGYVDLAGLSPGRYAVYAEKGMKVSQTEPQVEVPAEAGMVEITLRLNPGVFVEARVREKTSEKPIEGARVTWSSAGLGQFSRHQTSDGAGLVRLGPLAEWGGVLRVRATGFVARVVSVELPGEREPPGPGVQIIDLEEAAAIEARVVDAKGFPVAGATVEVAGTDLFGMPVSIAHLSDEIADAHFDWASRSENVLIPAGELGVMLGPVPPIPLGDVVPREGRLLTTDARGYVVIDDVPPGEVVVLARHPEHMDGKSDILTLAPDARVKTTVVLGQGEPLRGRVVDHRGFPVENARVQVSAAGFDRRVTAETDGTFLLEAAPETVSVRVSRIERPLRVVFARDVKKEERASEIQITLPEPREDAVVVIRDAAGEPVQLAQVAIVSLERSVPFKKTSFTDDEGQVTFEEAVGLRVRLTASAPGYVEKSVELKLQERSSQSLTQSLAVSGVVRGVRGRLPAGGASVVFRAGSLKRTAIADDLGTYRLVGLPPGPGELSGQHPEFGKGRMAVRVTPTVSDRPVELPDLILAPTLEVRGIVVDETGAPVAGALIAASRLSPYLPAGGSDVVLGQSDGAGEFSVEVERLDDLYLFGAAPGRAYGFSDRVPATELDRVDGVRVVLDRTDRIPPNELATVLIAIEDRTGRVVLFAVAEGSDAKSVGLEPDDVLLEIDGVTVEDEEQARQLLSGVPSSDVRVVVGRAGSRREMVVAREPFLR